jgi:type III pantothenate kinase
MTLLAVDIGNTQVKWARVVDGTIQSIQRFATTPAPNEPELIQRIQTDPTLTEGVTGVIYCTVVPTVGQQLHQALHTGLGENVPILNAHPAKMTSPIDLGGYQPEQLGADRWVSLCAAQAQFPHQSVMVLNFGTATTLDVLSAAGVYQGGLITPGFQTFGAILSQRTAQLPPVPLERPAGVLGKSTVACLQSGIVNGYRALIQGLMDQAQAESPYPLQHVVATGGLAPALLPLLPSGDRLIHCPTLTLEGLIHLFQQTHPA